MTRTPLRIALVIAVLPAIVVVPTALAGKGGKPGGGGGGGSTTGGGSLSLVLLDSTDGLAHYGQRVTFNVTTSATQPYVSVNCYQGGVRVASGSAGFFASYPWSKEFTLSSSLWVGGAADCTAALYTTKDGTRITTLASMTFHVYA